MKLYEAVPMRGLPTHSTSPKTLHSTESAHCCVFWCRSVGPPCTPVLYNPFAPRASFTLKHRCLNGVLQWIKLCSLKLSSKGKTSHTILQHLKCFWRLCEFPQHLLPEEEEESCLPHYDMHSSVSAGCLCLLLFLYLCGLLASDHQQHYVGSKEPESPQSLTLGREAQVNRVRQEVFKPCFKHLLTPEGKMADNWETNSHGSTATHCDLGAFLPNVRWHLAIEPLGGQPASQEDWQWAELDSAL